MNDTVIAKVCVCAVCVTEAEALSHRPALTRSVAGSYKIYVQFLKVKSKLNLFFGEKKREGYTNNIYNRVGFKPSWIRFIFLRF